MNEIILRNSNIREPMADSYLRKPIFGFLVDFQCTIHIAETLGVLCPPFQHIWIGRIHHVLLQNTNKLLSTG